MSEFAAFLKSNKKDKPHEFFAACKDFVDADGNPIMWELRHVPTCVKNKIESDCTTIKSNGKVEFNTALFRKKLVAAAVVYPNLRNAELMDSYMKDYPLDERTPENLLELMLDDIKEYNALGEKVNQMMSVEVKDAEKNIEIAKN